MKTRDEAAREYVANMPNTHAAQLYKSGFIAGWDARESELAELRTRLTLAESHGSIKYAYKAGCLEKELAEARAQIEAMRKVVGAAKQLDSYFAEFEYEPSCIGEAVQELGDALDALAAAKEKTQ